MSHTLSTQTNTRASKKHLVNAFLFRYGQELQKPLGTTAISDGPTQHELSKAARQGKSVIFKTRTSSTQFTPISVSGSSMYSPDSNNKDFGGTDVVSLKLWGLRKIGWLFVPFHAVYQTNETVYLREQIDIDPPFVRDVVASQRTGWLSLDFRSLCKMLLSHEARYVLIHGQPTT